MIRIYTIPQCGYCTELKTLLTDEAISFVELNVLLPENNVEYDKITEITKSDDVPIIKVDKHLLIPNISFKTINEAVDLIKKFLSGE